MFMELLIEDANIFKVDKDAGNFKVTQDILCDTLKVAVP